MILLFELVVFFYSLQNSCGNEIFSDLRVIREVEEGFMDLVSDASVAFFTFEEKFWYYTFTYHGSFENVDRLRVLLDLG